MDEHFLHEDFTQETATRFVSFTSGDYRFELALMKADCFKDKTMVLHLLKNRQGLLNQQLIEQDGYLERLFQLNEWEAEELRSCLRMYLS